MSGWTRSISWCPQKNFVDYALISEFDSEAGHLRACKRNLVSNVEDYILGGEVDCVSVTIYINCLIINQFVEVLLREAEAAEVEDIAGFEGIVGELSGCHVGDDDVVGVLHVDSIVALATGD